MIGSMIHIDTGELSVRAMSPKFTGRRPQHSIDIGRATAPKPSRLHVDIEWCRGESGLLAYCSRCADHGQAKQPENCHLSHSSSHMTRVGKTYAHPVTALRKALCPRLTPA